MLTTAGMAARKPRHLLDGLDGRRKADALRRVRSVQGIEPCQRERQMRPALVIGHRVNFVDDHGARQSPASRAILGGEQNVQRFRRGDQNMRALLAHLLALGSRRIAGAHSGANRAQRDAPARGELRDLRQRDFQILMDVVAERFERRNVNHFGLGREVPGARGAYQRVNDKSETRPMSCPNR